MMWWTGVTGGSDISDVVEALLTAYIIVTIRRHLHPGDIRSNIRYDNGVMIMRQWRRNGAMATISKPCNVI